MKKSGRTPLVKALEKHMKLNPVPFHMPGHKNGRGIQKKFAGLMQDNPFHMDLTELPGLDDLHNPTGPIKEAQIRAARLFGADKTFFLVNGTTVGLHAAILSACRPGDEILLPREAHRSVIGACVLGGLYPRYLPLNLDRDYFIPYPSRTEEICLALKKYPTVSAVLQVYPSYYGLAGDVAGAAGTAHARGIPLIVDEAHGAHFRFSSRLPATAIESGADIAVQSTHKTLGSFTQASMLHIRSSLIDGGEVARHLAILQSTSPSYLLMASLDAATGHLESAGESLIDKTVRNAYRIRKKLKAIPGIRCLGDDVEGKIGEMAVDPTKIYVSVKELGLSGYRVAETLLRDHNIQVEMSDRFNILCMFSLGNTYGDGDRLARALKDISASARGLGEKRAPKRARKRIQGFSNIKTFPVPDVIMNPRDAWFAEKKCILLKDAAGETAGEIIAPYPPGVPLVCPGETITPEIIELIREFKAASGYFHGPADPELKFITVID